MVHAARIALVALAAVLALVVGGVVVFASIDQRALTERVVGRVVATASEKMGREVTFDGAHGRLLPDPRVTITGLAVAGRAGEPPLVETEAVHVQLRIWPILRSLGREIVVREVAVVGPDVHLIRDADASWNVEGLGGDATGDRSEADAGPGTEVTLARLSMVEGTVNVIDRGGPAGSETAVALTHLGLDAHFSGGELSRLEVRGALASVDPNFEVDLEIAPDDRSRPAVARADAPPAAFPAVRGSVALHDADLARLAGLIPAGIAGVVRGGRLDVEADVDTAEDGLYEIRGGAQLSGVRMRGGEPARGAMRGVARVDPESPSAFRAVIDRASLRGPGIDLAGSGTFTGEPRSMTFDVRGPLLDLDTLLATLPEGEDEASQDDGAVLPASLRRTLEETTARGTLRVERVVHGALELRELAARASLRGRVLELEQGEARLHGGRIVTSGTRVDLRPAAPEWTLQARLEGVDLGSMMRQLSGDQALTGRLDGRLDVEGAGAAWDQVKASARGSGVVQLRDGVLTTGDLGARAAAVVAQGLRLAGRGSATVDEVGRGRTELGDLRVAFRVERGSIVIREPLTVHAPFGGARLDGRIGLDRSLHLTGTVILSPDFVDEIAGVRPAGAIEVPLSIGGSLSDPAISTPAPGDLASTIARSAAREGVRVLEEELEGRGEEGVREVLRRLPIPGLSLGTDDRE